MTAMSAEYQRNYRQRRKEQAKMFAKKSTETVRWEYKCTNPHCGRNHNFAFSRLVGEHGSRRIDWYCGKQCKDTHAGLVVK